MIKIIGGEYRSRILEGPPDASTTRPITARVKEAVFNLLRGWCDDAVVLDLFAGVGAIGLEAVSRGAREVVLVELNTRIASILATPLLPPGLVRKVLEFWLHAGYY